jgi:hypothetical protein
MTKKEYDDEAALAKIADYLVAHPELTFEQAAEIVYHMHPELIDQEWHTI